VTAGRLIPGVYRAGPVLVVIAVMSGLSWLFGLTAINVDLSILDPPTKIPGVELVALVTAMVVAALVRPRFWDWERLGGSRTRLVAGGVAAIGIALPLVPVFVGVIRLPSDAAWAWLVPNALILAGVMFGLSALISPALAGGVVILGYFAITVATAVDRSMTAYSPLVFYPGPGGNWPIAAAVVTAAVLGYGYTHGSTSWARRWTRNES
jgi:hypothetical protein